MWYRFLLYFSTTHRQREGWFLLFQLRAHIWTLKKYSVIKRERETMHWFSRMYKKKRAKEREWGRGWNILRPVWCYLVIAVRNESGVNVSVYGPEYGGGAVVIVFACRDGSAIFWRAGCFSRDGPESSPRPRTFGNDSPHSCPWKPWL